MNPDTPIGNAAVLRYLLDIAPKAHPYTTILQTLPNNSDLSFMEILSGCSWLVAIEAVDMVTKYLLFCDFIILRL